MGIGPFQTFKTFNRCATFKTFNGLRIAEYFHVSGILETSKRSNKLNCHVDVRTHWKVSETYGGEFAIKNDVLRLENTICWDENAETAETWHGSNRLQSIFQF
jgi:hypothetical protein